MLEECHHSLFADQLPGRLIRTNLLENNGLRALEVRHCGRKTRRIVTSTQDTGKDSPSISYSQPICIDVRSTKSVPKKRLPDYATAYEGTRDWLRALEPTQELAFAICWRKRLQLKRQETSDGRMILERRRTSLRNNRWENEKAGYVSKSVQKRRSRFTKRQSS